MHHQCLGICPGAHLSTTTLISQPKHTHAQADLEAKYARVLAAYARDLAAVQAQYERHKLKPPLPRNAPHVAGHILWARQLLRRIEVPMQRFAPPTLYLGPSRSLTPSFTLHFSENSSSQSMHHGAAAASTDVVSVGTEGVPMHFASGTPLHARLMVSMIVPHVGRYCMG